VLIPELNDFAYWHVADMIRCLNGQKAMIDLLIGYAVAIAIVLVASRPLSIDRSRW
jgi:hypothetical protein